MTPVSCTVWDPIDYLDDEETMGYYLESALASGDPQHIQNVLDDIARARQKQGLTSPTSNQSLAQNLIQLAQTLRQYQLQITFQPLSSSSPLSTAR